MHAGRLSDEEKAAEPFLDQGHASSSSSRSFDSAHPEEDREKVALAQELTTDSPAETYRRRLRLTIWMVINTLATIAIVFTNKTIFDDPSFRNCQLSFASFHFTITGLTLYVVSRPRFGVFVPKRAAIREVMPLAAAMCFQVVLPNISLAYSSVTFYQLARILLTPVVALLNYLLYKSTIPRAAIIPLVPACIGVGIVSYYDSLPTGDSNVKATSMFGAIMALAGVFASSLYTVWIGFYHKKLQMTSMQLLLNQAPVGAAMLLYAIPWIDTAPNFTAVHFNKWVLIFLSGLFACLINLSQFFIIDGAGPVSSTVVGHVKTCTIVALGWITSGRAVGDKSLIGILLALGGIIAYSIVMIRIKR